MRFELTFKNLRPRMEIRQRAEMLFKKMEKFLDPAAEGSLLVSVEHGKALLELLVTTRGETHKAVEEHDELRTSLDKVFHNMENQLRRAKERRVQRRKTGVEGEDGWVDDEVDADDAEDVEASA